MTLNIRFVPVLFTVDSNLLSIESEGRIGPFHAMKAYKLSGGIVPLILNLGTRLR